MNFREILHRSGGSPTRRFLLGSLMSTYLRAPEESGAHIQHGCFLVILLAFLMLGEPLSLQNIGPKYSWTQISKVAWTGPGLRGLGLDSMDWTLGAMDWRL